ncbi:MAG: type II toxin-antitoxin system RelE/ParE family toxin [Phycisphaeraceae bacterium]|nr:type II toxin-antitoxin system RelE/ParE family toxin [Phycisphaeraceae bacterium]
MARVVLTDSAAKELEALPLVAHTRILKVLERLADWPDVSGAKPMRGRLAGRFRIRTGDYRVLFSVRGRGIETTVVVEQIGHRDGFYEE